MELWIRSADKEILLKVNELEIEENMIIAFDNSKYQCLGAYKTKERALKVLDEIQNLLQPQEYEIEKGNGYYTKSTNISTYVYEMPKE